MSQNIDTVGSARRILSGEKWGHAAEYVIMFLVVLISFILCRASGLKNNHDAISTLTLLSLMCLSVYVYVKQKKNKLTSQDWVSIITVAGFIMGIGNMLGHHIFERGYDQGYVSSGACGHFGYMMNIVEGHLPSSNAEQFYQPPFVHAISAVFIKLSLLKNGGNAEDAVQYVQIVNCTAMCFMFIAFRNFLGEIELKEKFRPFVMAMIALFPNFYLMGGRANNDMFVTYFMLLCVINTCRWYKNRDMKSIVCLALSFGFGMMSKISCGVVAVVTGPVMLYLLIKDISGKANYKETIKQLAVFASICLPLALWYPLRNYILFNQPLTYIQRLDESIPIYMGKIPWYRRLFGFSLINIIKNPFYKYPEPESVPVHLLKTSLFGEWDFDDNILVCRVFLLVNLIVILVSAASCVYVVIKGKRISQIFRFSFAAVWVVLFLSFMQFNVRFPYVCTEDFRYVAVSEIMGALFLGYAMQTIEEHDTDKKYGCIIEGIKVLVITFAFLSIAVYI